MLDRRLREGGSALPRFQPAVLRLARERRGLSRTQLCQLLDVGRNAVARWEGGQAQPSPRSVPPLAELLGIEALALYATAASGPSLIELRHAAGLTLQQLSKALDVPYWTVRRFETGETKPTPADFQRLSQALEFDEAAVKDSMGPGDRQRRSRASRDEVEDGQRRSQRHGARPVFPFRSSNNELKGDRSDECCRSEPEGSSIHLPKA